MLALAGRLEEDEGAHRLALVVVEQHAVDDPARVRLVEGQPGVTRFSSTAAHRGAAGCLSRTLTRPWAVRSRSS